MKNFVCFITKNFSQIIMTSRPTVSILIIGDEVLKGQTTDTNSHFLCQELYKCGIKVSRVSVIPDEIDIIAEEIRINSEKYSFVLTSGGIGPTHDDVTYDGIAKAFNESLHLNTNLQKVLNTLCFNMGLDEMAALKMSHVPKSSEIHYIYNSAKKPSFPIISVKNVFAFSGIPSYLEYSFSQLKSLFISNSVKFFTKNLYIDCNEFMITNILNIAVKEFQGVVKFGSYPDVQNDYYQVKLTLEADSEDFITNAEAFLRSHLPHNNVVGCVHPTSKEAIYMLDQIFIRKLKTYDPPFSKTVETSLQVIDKCYTLYSLNQICLSFNGGKDCTVLLHLTHIFLEKFFPTRSEKLKVLYVCSKQPFTEIEDFIQLCVKRYNLNLITYDGPIKNALNALQNDHPEIKAIFLGSRNTDPYCSDLDTFQMTDSDWPQFMRVSPLIPWTYPYIWKFLRTLEVPYCSLYDRGYTSLGCQHNTFPNAQLLTSTKDGMSYYMPAYLLKDPNQEREGRICHSDNTNKVS